MRRIGIFGWGVVAPGARDVATFARRLEQGTSWLERFDGFGPDNFLVGRPDFAFADYRDFIAERFKPSKFAQLESKMGLPVQYAVGCFIQALAQNPGLEAELRRLGEATHVYVGTGLGDFEVQYRQSLALHRARRRWLAFWAAPERNPALRAFLATGRTGDGATPPADPATRSLDTPTGASPEARETAEDAWWEYWAQRSAPLAAYLEELRAIEGLAVSGEVETGKLSVLKEKQRRLRRLEERSGAPLPPWQAVSANLIWNIDNIPAAQISMIGKLTGPAIATSAACATFGVALYLAVRAIRAGDATAVVIGGTDPPPHPLTVGAFYNARVISADRAVSLPLTELRGTHVAGGAVVWIVADGEHMTARGVRPLGLEPVAVAVTSDADHIITPSKNGPRRAMRRAIAEAEGCGEPIVAWDLHATATPGDWNEVETVRELLPAATLITARKGTFGHGMSAGGGFELTAQYLSAERGASYPTALDPQQLHPEIARLHRSFVFARAVAVERSGLVGKLSMGVGGVNACVISRPLRLG